MNKKPETRTVEQFLEELAKNDLSVKDWCRQKNLDFNTVYGVLGGRISGRRGMGRQAMRVMGLPVPPVAFDKRPKADA